MRNQVLSTTIENRREEIVNKRLDELRAAESILIDQLQTGEPIPGPELAFLDSLGIAGQRLLNEQRRLHDIAQFKSLAGTVAQRDELQSDLADAQGELARNEADLQRVINEAQSRLTGLRQRVNTLEADIARREEAVKGLQRPELLPLHARATFNASKTQFNGGIRKELETRKARRAAIADILSFSQSQGIEHAKLRRDEFRGAFDDHGRLLPGAWERYCQRLRDEAERLAGEISELQPKHDAAKSELDTLLNYHIA